MSSWNRITPSLSTTRNKNSYVSIVLQGDLGNRILQILAAQHFSEKTGRTFVLHERFIVPSDEEETAKQLQSLFPSLTYYKENVQWNVIQEESFNAYRYQSDIFKRFPGQNVVLQGFFFNYRYFPRQLPSFSEPRKYNTFFLHIPFDSDPKLEINLTTYYKRCINDILKISDGTQFLVFSDNNENAEELIKIMDLRFKYTLSTSTDSLAVLKEMSSCYGGVCANSSLAWLAAFFQKPRGIIYMPDAWEKKLPTNQLNEFFPEWVKVISIKEPVIE